MKTTQSSVSAIIRYESDLVHHFGQLLKDETDLHWKTPPSTSIGEQFPWVELTLDTKVCRFKPVFSLKPSIPELESILATWNDLLPPLLVAPELIPRLLDFCRQKRLAAVDLNGRVYLRADGLFVDRRSLPGRDFRYELEPRNVFVGKSERIIRSLLTDRERVWTQSELLSRSKASSGLVSRIVQHLISQGFLEKQSAREFRIADHLGLINAWAKADEFNRRITHSRYTTFGGDPVEIAHKLQTWAREQSVPIAFTQWLAAWLRHPYTEPVITSAYVARLPETAILEQLGLRPVNDAGKVWLFVPTDEGVFLETQNAQELPLVTDAQIYLDLLPTGLRGPDAANALRHWGGFCRK